MQICDQIRRLRCSLNLSQERFGQKVGLSGKSVSAYETGRAVPTVKVLAQIANTYNVNFTEMSNNNRVLLNQRVKELEQCFLNLRQEIYNMLSSKELVNDAC